MPNNRLAPSLGWRPLREILDPPLLTIVLDDKDNVNERDIIYRTV